MLLTLSGCLLEERT